MAGRKVALFLGVLLLGTTMSFMASAQTVFVTPPAVSLGFDQSSLTPVSQGTPVYTQGDVLWISSQYQSTLQVFLTPPNSGPPAAGGFLAPGQATSLYQFRPGDPTGTWTMDLVNTTGGFVGSLSVVVAGLDENSSVQYNGASVSAGFISTSYSLRADGAYDLQACVLGSSVRGLLVSIPQGFGTGVTFINMSGGAQETGGFYSSVVRGTFAAPTEFWFELYHPYSFVTAGGNSSELFSRVLQVATSSRLVLGQSSGANVTSGSITFEAGLREGRYTLQAYFRSELGFQVVQVPVLRTRGGTWLPLTSCVASSQPSSLAFSLKTPLQAPVASWPRKAVVMFRSGGLEDYANVSFDGGLSSLTLVAAPWNQTLGGLTATVTGAGVEGSETINGTVYVLSSTYPTMDSFALSLGGKTYETVESTLPASYTSGTLRVPAGKLVVQTNLNGASAPGTKITLLGPGNFSSSKASDSTGKATFYLPPGNFTVSASAGSPVTSSVRMQAGIETDVTLELGGPETGTTLLALEALGAVFVAANGFVWWRWWRNRKAAPR